MLFYRSVLENLLHCNKRDLGFLKPNKFRNFSSFVLKITPFSPLLLFALTLTLVSIVDIFVSVVISCFSDING